MECVCFCFRKKDNNMVVDLFPAFAYKRTVMRRKRPGRSIKLVLKSTIALLILASASFVGAQTLQTLYSFNWTNGAFPYAALTFGKDGNLYGTTKEGGSIFPGTVFQITTDGALSTLFTFNPTNGVVPYAALTPGNDGNFYGTTKRGGSYGYGTAFKVTPSGILATLVSFSGTNGAYPYAPLTLSSDGSFYGTTAGDDVDYYGTVFRMTTNGNLTTVHFFTGIDYYYGSSYYDGGGPQAGLALGNDGYLYGTTSDGFSYGYNYIYGSVFKMSTTGALTTLVYFNITNGAYPCAGLTRGTDGNMYGTTSHGGNNGAGYGTVFKMTPYGTLTTLHSFTGGNDGENLQAGLTLGTDGNLYGTTSYGGSGGYGTVFKVSTNGASFRTLVSFNSTNGAYPYASLALGTNGNLYGTTEAGGSYGYGTVFQVTTNGILATLVSFSGTNGAYPYAALALGHDGHLYGTTAGNGGYGTVFMMSNGRLSTVVAFNSTNGASANGAYPYGGLTLGSDGNFYGTTEEGGARSVYDYGKGTAFKVTTNGTLTTLVSFNSTNGEYPYAGLTLGHDGNFYGTTYYGGSGGEGTVFKVTTNGTLTTLVAFSDLGAFTPYAGLTLGNDGNFYGTTEQGGQYGSSGSGTVFKVTTNGTLTTLAVFKFSNGELPKAALTLGKDGNFYGTTWGGGSGGYGTAFKMTVAGTLTTLISFNSTNGANPTAALTLGNDGNLFGTTEKGGSCGYGTLFKVATNGTMTTLISFVGTNGAYPQAALTLGSDGNLYGTTSQGGSSGEGTVFCLLVPPYTWTTNNGTITITGYTGSGGGVTIPSSISGLPVTSIGYRAFCNCYSLTSISIPNSVTNIGGGVFASCTSLTAVYFMGNAPSFGSSLFSGDNTTIVYCLPGTTGWGTAFGGCPTVLWNPQVQTSGASFGLGTNGFGFTITGSSNLVIVVEACTNLANPVWLPVGTNTLTSGSSYFSDPQWTNNPACFFRLASGPPDAVPPQPSPGFTYTTNSGTITITGYTGPGGTMTIPRSINGLPVTSIGYSAFSGRSSLTNVMIPNSVTNIGNNAFYYCIGLSSVTIPNSVTSIGNFAFTGCTSLSAITVDTLNSFYSSVDGVLFDWNQTTLIQYPVSKAGTSYTIPVGVTNIAACAFQQCLGLTSVAIPNSVISIGSSVFSECNSLNAITVDMLNSFYSSVDGVLFDRNQTTLIQYPGGKDGNYTIPNGVTNIVAYAFQQCPSLTGVAIPDSVTSIGNEAFQSCSSLANVTISNSVTSIGSWAFESCTSLASVTLGTNVTSIGSYAFDYCTRLTNVTIPNSVTNIGSSAFCYCTSLTSVTIPSSVTSVGSYAFYDCTSLTNVTIPSSVTSIGSWAFESCTSLTSVMIPSSVTSIGSWAFESCTSLTSVMIGTNVTDIGDNAFDDCTSLTSVTIPNSVTNIGSWAFASCTSLTSVTIPSRVTSIGSGAFEYCTSLVAVYFKCDAPSLGSSVFSDDNATVYYLPGTRGWSSTFGGLLTALWFLPNPLILNNGPGFGVQTNRFSFVISWATNISVVVEACTNVANPTWSPVSTNTLTGGSSYFSDPQWTNYPSRLYRLRSP
jgi:uncharacterized repeat protein (TIGR03803 family)